MHSQSETTFNVREKPESYAAKYSEITGIGCPVWLLFTLAMARQLKLESEACAPDWAPGNFSPARVWAFVLGWQQKPELQISTHPQVIVVSPGQEGEEGAEAGYRPPLKTWLGAIHTQEGFFSTKSACFPQEPWGLCAKTEWLTGSQALPRSGRHSIRVLLPAEQESSCCLAPRQSRLFRVSLDGNTTEGTQPRVPCASLQTSTLAQDSPPVFADFLQEVKYHHFTHKSDVSPWAQSTGMLCK